MIPPYEQSTVPACGLAFGQAGLSSRAKVEPSAQSYRGFPYINNGVPTDSKNRFSPDLQDINFDYHYLILAFCFLSVFVRR